MDDERVEFEGKTVDEAIQKACEYFGVPREKLSIDILSEGAGGFLGLGIKPARIMVSRLDLIITEELSVDDVESTAHLAPHEPVKVNEPVIERTDRGSEDADLALRAKNFLEGLLARMYIPAPVEVTEEADKIILNIKGDGEGLLIGKKGQNLDAIQHITNKAIMRQSNGKKMIVVDTEAYRKRREEALVNLANRLAQQVKKTKKMVTVSNMNAHDRRIIHLALQGDNSLITKSRGEGDYRKIVIMPAGRLRQKGKEDHGSSGE